MAMTAPGTNPQNGTTLLRVPVAGWTAGRPVVGGAVVAGLGGCVAGVDVVVEGGSVVTVLEVLVEDDDVTSGTVVGTVGDRNVVGGNVGNVTDTSGRATALPVARFALPESAARSPKKPAAAPSAAIAPSASSRRKDASVLDRPAGAHRVADGVAGRRAGTGAGPAEMCSSGRSAGASPTRSHVSSGILSTAFGGIAPCALRSEGSTSSPVSAQASSERLRSDESEGTGPSSGAAGPITNAASGSGASQTSSGTSLGGSTPRTSSCGSPDGVVPPPLTTPMVERERMLGFGSRSCWQERHAAAGADTG